MEYRNKISDRIAYMALTQKEVSQKIGYSEMGFSNIIIGKTKFMSFQAVNKLMKVLKCDASKILNRHDMLRYQEDLNNSKEVNSNGTKL